MVRIRDHNSPTLSVVNDVPAFQVDTGFAEALADPSRKGLADAALEGAVSVERLNDVVRQRLPQLGGLIRRLALVPVPGLRLEFRGQLGARERLAIKCRVQ